MKRIYFRINRISHFLKTSVRVAQEWTLFYVSEQLLAVRETVVTLALGLLILMKINNNNNSTHNKISSFEEAFSVSDGLARADNL